MIRRAWHRATRTWREAAAIIADEQTRAQSPAPPPFASPSGGGTGPHPVPGQQEAPVPAHGRPPRPAPAPAHDCGPVQAGIGFNREGCMYVWEPAWGYWQHKQHRLPFNVTEWEAKLP